MLLQRLGLRALRPTRPMMRARAYATSRPPPSPNDEPVRGQEPPLPTEATPQDATVPPMYPNAPPVRGEQPPLPTEEDSSASAAAPLAASGQAAPAHEATWGQESPLPTPSTAKDDTVYPRTPPEPPRGQEPPLPGEAVQAPFTAAPVAPVRQEQPPPPPAQSQKQAPPPAQPQEQAPPPPPPPPRKKRASTKMLLVFFLGGVLGFAYVPWYRRVKQESQALEAILVERERAGEKYIEGQNARGQYILKSNPETSKREV
ncbi:hypothetical protein CcaverHIS002_0208740 [Cutaneotrichosporon cavernicola]|uniref:Uncharacterized protein n=1 Tax=Cutaneotrichosporon cavernicola TaxID=279322 RepID=A0AA48L2M1_9TREE|nr:uncharacterized protein CcaverHIS019_0208750 [Cutaneotrichosporon cavernicola]BEI81714.1 hypothetical protein CcaverHIS002_0208740 [Cutaneotrichosporon cavernicola]BEI89513.1 hypothetical protein CcaverHIS019_0208750 [Cutaneotrichosporon cavernicola]BEI97286.1 hypothetical protein CcaverHIS631_0208750 [Cutaneotrichosporon cavernicola]BEJ05060.1 hypothetical protein CcaverHIS641_0208770 [Cutaneotrichosporon cavernicola]